MQSASRYDELDAAIAKKRFHPIVRHAIVAMQSDEGLWFAHGMPLDRVHVLQARLKDAARDDTLAGALRDLQRLAVAVSRKPGARVVATHVVLLCEAFIAEGAARAPDVERIRRSRALLGAAPARALSKRPAPNGGGALAQLRASRLC